MKFYDLNYYYIVTDVKEHSKYKSSLLDLINQTQKFSCKTELDNISSTDWTVSDDNNRPYLKVFYEMITPYIRKLSNKMKFKKCNITRTWFQVYEKEDNHSWHVHNGSNWTNVYYLNLPDDKIKTEIYDIKTNKIINNIEVKEGQILTFPAGVIHRSPKNTLNDNKVIISFNSDFDELALTI